MTDTTIDCVDAFAGPGGWSEACKAIGLGEIGIENDPAACATRRAAGHLTVQADVSTCDPVVYRGVAGFIASPPCQAFSTAGKGIGRDHIPGLVDAIHRRDWSFRPDPDPRVWLALEVGRWVEVMSPEWVALEQVPTVLPLWRAYAQLLRADGFSVWCGVLNAADFGVPQTRERAILVGSRVRAVSPPESTHAESPAAGLFGTLEPWVTMAEAVGSKARSWTVLHTNRDQRPDGSRQTVDSVRPAPALTGKAGGQWVFTRPATTIAGDSRCFSPGGHMANDGSDNTKMIGRSENTIKLTIADALALQSFRPDYPVQGTRTKQFEQIGNAIPPRLAEHVLRALLD